MVKNCNCFSISNCFKKYIFRMETIHGQPFLWIGNLFSSWNKKMIKLVVPFPFNLAPEQLSILFDKILYLESVGVGRVWGYPGVLIHKILVCNSSQCSKLKLHKLLLMPSICKWNNFKFKVWVWEIKHDFDNCLAHDYQTTSLKIWIYECFSPILFFSVAKETKKCRCK